MPKSHTQNSKQKPLTDKIYEQILEQIFSGKRKPGEPVSELALTKQLGVSRTPVHNAILQLTKDGLIKHEHNRRPVVRGLTPPDIHEIFEMRILLEGETARRASTYISNEQLESLVVTHAAVIEPNENRDEWLRLWADYDDMFHRTISKASQNHRLADDVSRYRLLHQGLKLHSLTEEDAPLEILRTAINEHEAIIDSLRMRDADGARDAMRVHLRRWQRFFAKLLKKKGLKPVQKPNNVSLDKNTLHPFGFVEE
jgi:DNA-binding GntR family transcriptional regulator